MSENTEKTPEVKETKAKAAAPAVAAAPVMDAAEIIRQTAGLTAVEVVRAIEMLKAQGEAQAKQDAAIAHEEAMVRTKSALKEQPHRMIRLPKEPYPKSPQSLVVGVNGVNYLIKRGVDVEVPQTIYDILVEGQYI